MADLDLSALEIARKLGSERFRTNDRELEFDLLAFWAWYSSDLASNTMRGVLAEYLVARDLGVAHVARREWDAVDLVTTQGVKVEVKSAAYAQSWHQDNWSRISFRVAPTLPWDSATNKYGTERKRQADAYVFAVLHHQDKKTLEPLNVEQWEFYILPTAVLDREIGAQGSISLSRLQQLGPVRARFGEVSAALDRLFPAPGRGST